MKIFNGSKNYTKNILSKLILLTIILVSFLTIFLFTKFSKNINNNLNNIITSELNRLTYNIVNNNITKNLLNKDELNDILIINKNANDEILYVDFNLQNAYQLLDNITNNLNKSLKSIEDGSINIAYYDNTLSHKTNSLVLSIPIGSTLNNVYLANLGPKIPVKINFIGNILTNLETKVTNYGLNNALVEVFITLKFDNEILTPFNTKTITLNYNTIISSMMIEGEVPSFYNGVIEKTSSIYPKKID